MLHYYNNGIVMIKRESCPEGFVKGKLRSVVEKSARGNRGKVRSAETNLKHSVVMKGKNVGKHLSEETKQKISESVSKARLEAEFKWYNNGVVQKQFSSTDEIPEGFFPGQLQKTEEAKAEWIEKIRKSETGKIVSEETRQKISENKSSIDNPWRGQHHSELTKLKISLAHLSKETKDKMYKSKKENRSFNTSEKEKIFEESLTQIFNKDDIFTQYSDERYPFLCDFYIKSKDLFIELNFHWTHGGHKFDPQSVNDIAKLNKWTKKAEESKFYRNAIDVWTKRDINKFNIASKNNLQYIALYTQKDCNEFFSYFI